MRRLHLPLALLIFSACASAEGAGRSWEFQNPGSWHAGGDSLRLVTPGTPGGPIRKPAEWAILEGESYGSMTLEVQARADAPVERMGRDVLLFFGYQSPTRFYYVHLSNETTAPHNGIFLVDDADRRRIDDASGIPRLRDAEWHRVKLVRDVRSGTIEVYFDDLPEPVLQATDTTLTRGRVGVGSFDDPASFRALRVTPRP